MKNNENIKKKINIKISLPILAIVLVLILIFGGVSVFSKSKKENKAQIVTISTLEKVIDISNISTFETIYNGVARVYDKKDTDKIDYYVSYESKVQSGFDVKKVKVEMDKEKKTIVVTLPEIELTDVTVDISSLDYIFMDDKAESDTVSAEAYKKCIEDAEEKVKSQNQVADLAKENAVNFIKAVTEPFVEQFDNDYQLVIE